MQQMQQEGIHNMSSPEGKLIYSDSNNELMHARKNDALIFSTPWCLNALSGYINIEYQISSGIETDTPTPPTGTIDINGTSYNLVVKRDRKSTRLNSSHQIISYAVFCLKKK